MAVAVPEIIYDRLAIKEEKEALLEHLEEVATAGDLGQRLRAREAAMQTVQWAIDAGRLPRELRDYPWGMDFLAAGIAAHVSARKSAQHPFQAINNRMGWTGMDGLPRLLDFPVQDEVPPEPRPMPPAVRPENLRPLDTTWKVDGRFLRLGEMTGADLRRKGDHAYRLEISNQRTRRLFYGLAEQVGERQRTDDVLDDDRTYRLAVEILGEEGALATLGRRSSDGAGEGHEALEPQEVR